jgi:phosphoglycerate dehydrogenase-like enzyme
VVDKVFQRAVPPGENPMTLGIVGAGMIGQEATDTYVD